MVTRFVVNYYILPIDANASARQNVVITTFCNVTTFWVATHVRGVTKDFFVFMDNLWGAHTIDRFASCRNNKLNRFNSLFWNPTCEAVDCFSQSWQNENNWFVPPISLVCRCIRYVLFCKASGTLIVPKWKSADFWPMIFKHENETHYYVRDVLEFRSPENIYEQGQNKNSIFGSERFSSPVLAVRLDAS